MPNAAQNVSFIITAAPIAAGALMSVVSFIGLKPADLEKKFSEIGKTLRERRIENWRSIMGRVESLSDEEIDIFLKRKDEEKVLKKYLHRCKRSLTLFTFFLFLLIVIGIILILLDYIKYFAEVLLFIGKHPVIFTSATILSIVAGMVCLFMQKQSLSKKYDEFLGV